MDYEGLIDDNRVLISLIACSMNYETAATFTYGHFNKVVFAVHCISHALCNEASAKQNWQSNDAG